MQGEDSVNAEFQDAIDDNGNCCKRLLQGTLGQMVPFASHNYPFSTHWPSLKGEPDFLTKTLGDVGYWHFIVILLMMAFNTPVVFHISSPEVSGVNHLFWCACPHHKFTYEQWSNLSSVNYTSFRGVNSTDRCEIKDLPYLTLYYEELIRINTTRTRPCYLWEFNKSRVSLLSTFDLACMPLPVNNIAESAFSIGSGVGGILCSYLADRFGRKKLLMGSQLMNVMIGFCIANAPTFALYLFYRVCLGFSCSAVLLCSLVICLEIAGGKWRDRLTTVFMFSYSLGYVTLYLLSKLFNSWIYLQYSITLLGIFLLSIWWAVPESPRWLLTVQNLPGLMAVLKSVSDINRKPLMPGTTSRLKNMPAMQVERTSVSLLMLFRKGAIGRVSAVSPFVFFFCNVTYYGLVLNVDLFTLGLLYSGAIEFIACLVVLILGLKNDVLMVTVANGLSGVCCLVGAYVMTNGVYLDIACMAARFFGGMTNSSLTTIIASMYPTLMRTLGLGWGNLFTSIGLAVATNIVLLSNWHANLPLLILGVSGLLGSFALLFLPGRVSRDLLDLPEEVEYCHKVISAIRMQEPRASPLPPQWSPLAPFPSPSTESGTPVGADLARQSPSRTSSPSESSAKTVLSQPSRKWLF